ncbi:hypothetical protein PIB30_075913 [Stylosanthes scabra]|uniref:Uncharacterized protein n=1 Tax=Stylosanthes scabra TaxID=79078 RepID=A0ABU6VSR5_9FABA|nr:hypothetical protein [Stylosanthes scabra]
MGLQIHRHKDSRIGEKEKHWSIPEDFQNDRMFYLQIDPYAVVAEIPSFFYLKYKDQLRQRMFFIDCNENLIEVMIDMKTTNGYTLGGLDNLVGFYGIRGGGWLKVVYVGEDVFQVVTVRGADFCKIKTESSGAKLYIHNTRALQLLSNTNASANAHTEALNADDLGLIEVSCGNDGMNMVLGPERVNHCQLPLNMPNTQPPSYHQHNETIFPHFLNSPVYDTHRIGNPLIHYNQMMLMNPGWKDFLSQNAVATVGGNDIISPLQAVPVGLNGGDLRFRAPWEVNSNPADYISCEKPITWGQLYHGSLV